MQPLTRCNAIADVERYCLGLHPEKEIAVVADAGHYYVYETPYYPDAKEELLYEGPASRFVLLEMH